MSKNNEGFIEDIVNEIIPLLIKHKITLIPFLDFIKNERGTYSLISLEKMAALLICPLEYIIDLNLEQIEICAQSASIFIKSLGLQSAYDIGRVAINLHVMENQIDDWEFIFIEIGDI
jgi:hypothetical protein